MALEYRFFKNFFNLITIDYPYLPKDFIRKLKFLIHHRLKNEWILYNQKFDLSLSSSNPNNFRFTVNDFGERGKLYSDVINYIEYINKTTYYRYNLNILKFFLDNSKILKCDYQTTFGLDIGPNLSSQRFKIYLEELPSGNYQWKKQYFEKISSIIDKKWVKNKIDLEKLAAICLDLYPNNKYSLKFYLKYKSLTNLIEKSIINEIKKLNLQKKYFYYIMIDINNSRKKIYKVHDYDNYDKENYNIALNIALKEIMFFLKTNNIQELLNRFILYYKFAIKNNLIIMPTLFSIGKNNKLEKTYDLYFSLKPSRINYENKNNKKKFSNC
jgi:hypothetical protein